MRGCCSSYQVASADIHTALNPRTYSRLHSTGNRPWRCWWGFRSTQRSTPTHPKRSSEAGKRGEASGMSETTTTGRRLRQSNSPKGVAQCGKRPPCWVSGRHKSSGFESVPDLSKSDQSNPVHSLYTSSGQLTHGTQIPAETFGPFVSPEKTRDRWFVVAMVDLCPIEIRTLGGKR